MNEGQYDYITLGNHDFNYGYDYLKKYLNNLNAKCICANVDNKTKELSILPYDIKVMENDLKVGIIGFTTDFINRWERPNNINNFTISDTFSAVKKCYEDNGLEFPCADGQLEECENQIPHKAYMLYFH